MSKTEVKEAPEKASQKWWNKCQRTDAGYYITHHMFKSTYDLLVSLEAKIEVLKLVLTICNEYEDKKYEAWIEGYTAEYQKLVKEHKL